jgi:hypothetical protein
MDPTSRNCCASSTKSKGIERIRFLTSHPNYFTDDLMDAIAELPRVMPHIELPIQAGDDEVLANMKRGYTQQQYRDLVAKDPQQNSRLFHRHRHHRRIPRRDRGTVHGNLPRPLRPSAGCGPPGPLLPPREGPSPPAAWKITCPKKKRCAACICWMICRKKLWLRSTRNISANGGRAVRGKSKEPLARTHPHQQTRLRRIGR